MKMTIMTIVVMFSTPLAAQIITVDDDGPADFNNLQDALAAASSGDEIRVAQGIYKPDQGGGITPGDRTATFQLKNGVALKGGYAGFGGAKASDADIAQYETILSGDLNGNDVGDPYDPSKDDNCYHVVTGSGTDGTAVLNGFTITAGKAHGRGDDDHGAGLYNVSGSPTLSWCRFISNKSASHGGGLYNVSGSPTLTNCTFSENRSGHKGGAAIYNLSGSMMLADCTFSRNWALYGSGGAMYNDAASPTMINCIFAGNSRGEEVGGCVYCGGGAMYNDDSSPTLINCTFSGNLSFNTQGGAMRNFGSSPTLINCTFSANSSNRYGGGIYSDAGSPTLINCILWGNMDRDGIDESAQIHTDTGTAIVDYSCIQGLTGALGGTGNIADDPLFMEPDGPDSIVGTEDDNLRLWPGSACADAGENSAVPPSVVTDLDADPRITNGIVDMGAYEGPKQGFVLSTESIIVPEGGTTTFTVALAIDPCGSVQVTVARERGDLDITLESGGSLSFDSSNYFVGQVVTLGAAEDVDTITGSALILVSSPGLVPFGVAATEGENEPYPNVLVVDAGAGGANNGSRWADAFNDLQDALAFAAANPEIEEIRVAQGRYRPAGPGGDREATFTIINGLAIRGGYAGFGEPNPDARDVDLYKAILSGDLNGDDPQTNFGDLLTEPNRAENSYHVVTGAGTDETAVLDGLIITGGNANGSASPDNRGGGMYCNSSSTVTNCIFTGNSASRGGGGMCCRPNEGKVTSPTLVDCKFIGNIATDGGGMSASDSDPTMVNCTFSGNLAINNGGGQMYKSDSVPTLSNCIFIGNSAGQQGGGMFCRFTFRMKLTNCTLSGNSAGSGGGGMYITDASGYVTLTNCVFWSDSPEELFEEDTGTVTVNYCCIQGGWPGVGNIETDPLFADPNNGDCHLLPGSPCIDAGDPNYVPVPNETDLDGNPRVVDGDNDGNSVVDMGAYEHRIIHVDGDANGANDGSSWHDAHKYLQDALSAATSGDEIWVAQGLYKPDQDSNHPGGTGDQSATFQLIN
ncbi:MAG: choice-of-anchor Q domain-containing protein, partial [Planctomycetota bacterium]